MYLRFNRLLHCPLSCTWILPLSMDVHHRQLHPLRMSLVAPLNHTLNTLLMLQIPPLR